MKSSTGKWVIGFLTVLALISHGLLPAVGQEDDEDAVAVQQPMFEIHPSNFESWVFGNVGGQEKGLERLNAMLSVRCATLEKTCQITDEQRRKCELAGRGDIKRFLDQVQQVREKFMLVRKDQQKFNEIWQDIHPLQQRLNANFFGENSLFAKAVRGTLTGEQAKEFETQERTRQAYHYRAKVELLISELETTVPLTSAQREKLVNLILESSSPPLRFGPLDIYYVLYRASQIPEAKWREIVDEAEYKALGPMLQQGRQMEASLIQQGALEDKKGRKQNAAGGGGVF